MSIRSSRIQEIVACRKALLNELGLSDIPRDKAAEEGGCGVVGFATSVPVSGRHIFEPSVQMHNRGNGKGGGIAAACLDPSQMGIDEAILNSHYLLQIAYLDPKAINDVEAQWVMPHLDVVHRNAIQPKADFRDVGLEVKPPDIVQYVVRAKSEALAAFRESNRMTFASDRDIEDEWIYQNSYRLNRHCYASLGEQRAFVLSHARDLLIFKVVGYAEQVVQYYGLEDFRAQIWIAHQRYPTKGRVWHPGGAHPFIGMNEALVHNGDFANYYSVSEYLRQHNIVPQFLTDTEVSALLFDLLTRVYRYPLEYVIEAIAPTTELDFDQLPMEKQSVYRAIQRLHVHGSPDGPWFFIIAASNPDAGMYRLLGITDTAMLRPQVFALQQGDVSIGLVASEKQAIDATLRSLTESDKRFRLVADRYWNARGGSHTDGGAFCFTVEKRSDDCSLNCADKFGRAILSPSGEYRIPDTGEAPLDASDVEAAVANRLDSEDAPGLFQELIPRFSHWRLSHIRWLMDRLVLHAARSDARCAATIEALGLLIDRRFSTGAMRRSSVVEIVQKGIDRILDGTPAISAPTGSRFARIDYGSRHALRPPESDEAVLVIFARHFPPEGEDCDDRLAVRAYELGWRRFIVYGLKGQRFHGCGFGPNTDDVRMDIYGSSGDYAASGIDGMEIRIHGNAQDQLGQILKRGKLVIFGDVGQTFMYGAKGGEVYVMGNAAGRPLINAVGKPRVVINGTCLDFLAESFMAGDPHKGGGFVVLNGVGFDDTGRVVPLDTPYPGSNLFSLASGGAIYARDPHRKLVKEQLNGGEFAEMTEADWRLILPYLEENQRLFGIDVERDLLHVDGKRCSFQEVYRKIQAVRLAVLAKATVPE
ncbi:MAG: glutamate synthase [Thermodesulfobacteriota bacterium]